MLGIMGSETKCCKLMFGVREDPTLKTPAASWSPKSVALLGMSTLLEQSVVKHWKRGGSEECTFPKMPPDGLDTSASCRLLFTVSLVRLYWIRTCPTEGCH